LIKSQSKVIVPVCVFVVYKPSVIRSNVLN